MSFDSMIERVLSKYDDVKKKLAEQAGNSDNFVKLSKEFSELEDYVAVISEYKKAEAEEKNLVDLLNSGENLDDEMKALVSDELNEIKHKLPTLKRNVEIKFLPKDAMDERNAIIEIRAGTGGDEAGLFASDLLRMYQKYAEHKGWKFELLSCNESGIGSIKEASANISGKGVFSFLKFESGVHRVQRVPVTESIGRVHTSTATVAVLPEAEEVDVHIDEKDLKIDVMRASGAGGQHVNKTESAVRLTHIPTGIVVYMQDERSQHMNRIKAMKILMSRIFEAARQKAADERASDRKNQVGTGDRSERIRTYNFPQGRVTDHRINLTLYKIGQIMDGTALDEIIKPLIDDYQTKLLEAFAAEPNE